MAVRLLLYLSVASVLALLVVINTYSYFGGSSFYNFHEENGGKLPNGQQLKQPPYASYEDQKHSAKYLFGGTPLHDLDYYNNNKKICKSKKKILFIFLIYSYPQNFRERRLVRNTWGNSKLLQMFRARKAFILGRSTNYSVNREVDEESRSYDDIIQEGFIDSFRNSTFKQVMALRWLSKRCPDVKYVIRVDDDYLLNIFALTAYLKSLKKSEKVRSILCEVRDSKKELRVVRNKHDKHYVSEKQYPASTYKPFCGGGVWIITRDVINEFYKATWKVPYMPLGDIYTTGLLASKVGNVTHHDTHIYSPLKTTDDFYTPQDVLSLAFLPPWRDYKRMWVKILIGTQKAAKSLG